MIYNLSSLQFSTEGLPSVSSVTGGLYQLLNFNIKKIIFGLLTAVLVRCFLLSQLFKVK